MKFRPNRLSVTSLLMQCRNVLVNFKFLWASLWPAVWVQTRSNLLNMLFVWFYYFICNKCLATRITLFDLRKNPVKYSEKKTESEYKLRKSKFCRCNNASESARERERNEDSNFIMEMNDVLTVVAAFMINDWKFMLDNGVVRSLLILHPTNAISHVTSALLSGFFDAILHYHAQCIRISLIFCWIIFLPPKCQMQSTKNVETNFARAHSSQLKRNVSSLSTNSIG